MVVITFIDLNHRIIPDVISLPEIGIGFFLVFFQPSISVVESLMGIIAGGGLLYLVPFFMRNWQKGKGSVSKVTARRSSSHKTKGYL
jgi:leader peptidase (prepilin peptidase)/N-methyltransferase